MADAAAATQQYQPPSLDTLKKYLDDYRTDATCIEARTQSLMDRDYYDNAFPDSSQLTPIQRAILRGRKQPEIIANRVKPAINGILGVVVQGKTDPRALMRNPPQDQQQPPGGSSPPEPGALMGSAAPAPMGAQAQPPTLDAGDVATMALRYMADTNNFQNLKLDVLENMGIEGDGGCIIETDADRETILSQVRWEEFFHDPRSRRHDFKDARYMGIAKWMYSDDLVARYPEQKLVIENSYGAGDVSGAADLSWMDKPDDLTKEPAWADSKTKRIMVVECYYRQGGDWFRCVFVSGGILLFEKSQYLDDKGRTACPMEMQSAFVDRKNRRYGLVRDMRGPQDEINLRRIKAAHEIASRQLQQTDPNAPPIDVDVARTEAAKPDGVIPPGWQVVPRVDVRNDNFQMLQEAKAEIERLGPVPAILARGNPDASGRAKQVDQQAGLTELARFLGRFTDWQERVYKQMWARARQSWTDPKWIRVTDDDGAPKYVRINDYDGQMDPMTGQPLGPIKNHIAKMDVDIVVDNVPDTATLQQEIFNELLQLATAYVGTPQAIPFSVLVEMSPLPKRREIVKKLEDAQAKAAQANQPQIQLGMQEKIADITKTRADAEKSFAQARNTEVDTVRSAMEGHAHALNPSAMLPQPKPNGAIPPA